MRKITILALMLFSGLFTSLAQVNVYHVNKTSAKPSRNGVFYVLPRTVLKIDVLVKTEENLKGPFSEYAEELLGLTNVVKYDFVNYQIENVEISSVVEPDPEQVYYIETGESSSKDFKSLMLSLNDYGFLVSASNADNPEIPLKQADGELVIYDEKSILSNSPGNFYALKNVKTKTDTIVRKITVDTALVEKFVYRTKLVEKNPKEQALEIVNLLEEVRESRMKLLTGFQETAYEPGTIMYMDKQLQRLENNYLDLFRGKTMQSSLSHTFYYIAGNQPEKDDPALFRFSNGTGVTSLKSGTGEEVTLELITNESAIIAGEFAAAQNNEPNLNGIAYRIPGIADCILKNDEKVLLNKKVTINQFGSIRRLPAQKFKVGLNPETGGINTVRFD